MLAPSPAELQIIRSMLIKEYGPNTHFLGNLPSLYFDVRQRTGKGFFEIFSKSDQPEPTGRINDEITEFVRTSLPVPADTVGFTLFIRNGYLSSFEGYTFGDAEWPDAPIEEWLVLAKPEV
jgi:hypothetical protein